MNENETLFEKMFLIGEGQKRYCIVCLPEGMLNEGYADWLINNRHAELVPFGKCDHK
jgi:hypothetical protein